ncbi:MAG: LysM peptidoglycan-binding domain-containing protein [Stellaceae bacterium]
MALAIAIVAFVLWTNSSPTLKPATPPAPAPASQANQAPPAAEPTPTIPSFDVVRVDPTGHAVIAGRAAPGAKVTVLDGDKSLGDVTADDRGEWVLVPTAPMSPGERRLTVEAADPKTGAKTKSADTVALAVGAATPSTPSPGTVAVLVPGNANEPAQALQRPNTGLSLDTAEFNDKGELMLSGHASPNATLHLYANNRPLATVTADAQGKWSSVSPSAQGQGKVELRVDELGANGSVARRISEPFEPPSSVASGGRYTVQAGNSLWVISRKAYGNGQHYTVIFGANKEHIKDPNLIYPGQVISLPKS